jgi:hypothetical protein
MAPVFYWLLATDYFFLLLASVSCLLSPVFCLPAFAKRPAGRLRRATLSAFLIAL